MANTFRSKEVYKKLRKEVHNRNTMVAVEGVYVSGQYRPPYYANPMLVINQIQCNKADVIPYTDDIVEAYDDFTYGIMDIIDNPDWHIDVYGKDITEAYDDFTYGIMDITNDMDWHIDAYGKDIVEAYDDFTYGIMDIITSNNISITACPPNNHNMTPEPMLRITQRNSTKATIT